VPGEGSQVLGRMVLGFAGKRDMTVLRGQSHLGQAGGCGHLRWADE
jgi:hypothetical protein